MLSIAGFFVIGVVIGLSSRSHKKEWHWPLLLGFFMAIIGGGTVSDFVARTTGVRRYGPPFEVTELASVRSEGSLSGSFFLATGRVEPNTDYIYYKALPDGGLQLQRVSAEDNNVVVYEDRDQGGELVIRPCKWVPKGDWTRYLVWFKPRCDIRHEFHMPEGSLVREFKVE